MKLWPQKNTKNTKGKGIFAISAFSGGQSAATTFVKLLWRLGEKIFSPVLSQRRGERKEGTVF